MRDLSIALAIFFVLVLAHTAIWYIDKAIDQYAESIENHSKLIDRY